ncbi:MAG: hypothetical protein KKC75_05235 [Nanoarchaeota archaeon]|nr:hypothetical protein [Nanoarchaeota archaeon]MBU1004221.1 hypothetical protein [Nanoarchaeota archaeon]MBU1945829.1 hypothetical protein [Nanoarchaeota archaeon]
MAAKKCRLCNKKILDTTTDQKYCFRCNQKYSGDLRKIYFLVLQKEKKGIKCICRECKNIVYLPKGRVKRFKYCSHSCSNKAKSRLYKGGEEFKTTPKVLPEYIKVKIKKTMKNKKLHGPRNYFYGKKHKGETKDRWSKDRSGKGNPAYVHGGSKAPYPLKFNPRFKRMIREKYHNTCQLCGKTKEEIKGYHKQLVPHHINYCKDCLNLENFTLLCYECNKKVNGNKELDRSYWFAFFCYHAGIEPEILF